MSNKASTIWAQIIQKRRKQLQLSQAEVIERMGPNAPTAPEIISMMENGRREPTLKWLPFLADALQLDRQDVCKLGLHQQAPELYAAIWGAEPPFDGAATTDANEFLALFDQMTPPDQEAMGQLVRRLSGTSES